MNHAYDQTGDLTLQRVQMADMASLGTRSAGAEADVFARGNRCFRDEHMPYMRDLAGVIQTILLKVDAYEAVLGEIREVMDQASTVRHAQVDTALSLVATMFLPLIWWTGVCGMNFYTGALGFGFVGNKFGALWFWLTCLVFCLLALLVFHYQGWSASFPTSSRTNRKVSVAIFAFLVAEVGFMFWYRTSETTGHSGKSSGGL